MVKLFVYGTLRKEGTANHFLLNSTLLDSAVVLNGYSLYSFGPYPFAIRTDNDKDFIVGDIYEVEEDTLLILDDYEGEMYKREIEKINGFYIYVKKDNLPESFPIIVDGDWFSEKTKSKRY